MESALNTAFNPAAPADEQQHAMKEATVAAMPSTVADMLPLVRYIQQKQEESDFYKSLARPDSPMPSYAVRAGLPGMQSVYLDDTWGQSAGVWRERWSNMTFEMMRAMVARTPVLDSVILTRIRQVKRFTRVPDSGKGPGFQIKMRDPAAKPGADDLAAIQKLQSFFTNCGWEDKPRLRAKLKRDNFSGLMAKLVRDSLELDSAPIETEWKLNGSGLDGIYAVDGATIRLCPEEGYQGDEDVFALQLVQGQVRSLYTHDDLIYVPRNPRTDVLVGGYGKSETESLVNVVTGFLNAFTYNTKFFDSNSIPRGLLHLSGDYSQDDLNQFRRYWNAMVKGINNAWTLPVMVSKNQESKASFENFGVDTTDAMFTKWMTFLTSIICAIYGIAPDEINFESFTNGTSSLSGSDTEEKLIHSKDKGLRPLLGHFEDLFTDYIVSEFGDKYVFRWTGLDEESAETRWDKVKTLATWNEARQSELNMDPVEGKAGDAPLNPALMGAWQQENQQPQEDYGTPGQFGQQPGEDGGEDGQPQGDQQQPQEDAGGPMDDSSEDMQKSFGLPVFTVEP